MGLFSITSQSILQVNILGMAGLLAYSKWSAYKYLLLIKTRLASLLHSLSNLWYIERFFWSLKIIKCFQLKKQAKERERQEKTEEKEKDQQARAQARERIKMSKDKEKLLKKVYLSI